MHTFTQSQGWKNEEEKKKIREKKILLKLQNKNTEKHIKIQYLTITREKTRNHLRKIPIIIDDLLNFTQMIDENKKGNLLLFVLYFKKQKTMMKSLRRLIRQFKRNKNKLLNLESLFFFGKFRLNIQLSNCSQDLSQVKWIIL